MTEDIEKSLIRMAEIGKMKKKTLTMDEEYEQQIIKVEMGRHNIAVDRDQIETVSVLMEAAAKIGLLIEMPLEDLIGGFRNVANIQYESKNADDN